MHEFLNWFNGILFLLFLLLYSYQFFYLFVALVMKPKQLPENPRKYRYCVLIAARNEENVIGNLIRSIREQTYPQELIHICVVADNCTDQTAKIAREAGAYVVERFNQTLVGKGYALDFLLKNIPSSFAPDAYLVFDADNTLDSHYIEEMNKVYAAGYLASTSYRNSCNYDSNWISAGYGLWFLRESRYLNQARMKQGTSCAISGTGFMIAASLIRKNHGWIHHLLTEDIEFSIDSVLHGVTIGYCDKAIVYDEQPVTFRQSWNQRLRWSKGFYQVFGKYGAGLVTKLFSKKSFAAYDMLMTIAPAMLISIGSVMVNGACLIYGTLINSPSLVAQCAESAMAGIFNYYLVLFFLGIVTTITEWRSIHAHTAKKLLYCLTFPLFMFTYVPIAIAAMRKNVQWTPIVHRGYQTVPRYAGRQSVTTATKMPLS